MKRILIVSDTHSSPDTLKGIVALCPGADLLLHCGDGAGDCSALALPHLYVRGNCDFSPDSPYERVFEEEGVRVLMTHGHMYNVKFGIDRLLYRAEELGAQLVLYGHTHTACIDNISGIIAVNPGCGRSMRYAVAELANGEVKARLY